MTQLILLLIAAFVAKRLLFPAKKPAPKSKPVAVQPPVRKKAVVPKPKEPLAAAVVVPVAETLVAVDVKTSGTGAADRIVTLAAIRLNPAKGAKDRAVLNLVFDPGRKSHAKAEKAHGYNDWILRHQDPLADRAAEIAAFIDAGDRLVVNDAVTDIERIEREIYAPLGRTLGKPVSGVVQECRERGLDVDLDALAARIGADRPKDGPRALAEAWFMVNLHLWLRDRPVQTGALVADPRPENFKEAPPQPFGPIPPRRKQKAPRVS